ncbi:DUF602 family protein [Tieghemostelium lacteum]|uniref:DUF602 family protein n=1 Tax=Tieghemostelium lacteum TaxID=361077 RepID=A0A152A881_TIELA|nr:DUF602 family protein [Tieghemostelium lacteum]|eukprot:KYR02443.1 DUF602 family protein [Tieghemostelium lacteum]
MGNDGGSVLSRDDLVKLKKRHEKAGRSEIEHSKWFLCKLSQCNLSDPIVLDDFGNLFNKEVILESLLNGNLKKNYPHIRSSRCVYPVHFSANPAYKKEQESSLSKVGQDNENTISPWYCPITGLEIGTHQRFNFNKSCGHVLSVKLFQIKESDNSASQKQETSSKQCLLCSKEYKDEDIIIINPNPDELEQMKLKLPVHKKKSIKSTTKHTTSKTTTELNVKNITTVDENNNQSKKRNIETSTLTDKEPTLLDTSTQEIKKSKINL